MITLPLVTIAGSVARLYRRACAWRNRQPLPSRHARGLAVVLAWVSLFSLGTLEGDVEDATPNSKRPELVSCGEQHGGGHV